MQASLGNKSKDVLCIEIVTSSPKENQALLDRTDDFLKWTETMKARPNKCWSVALNTAILFCHTLHTSGVMKSDSFHHTAD